MNNSVTNVVKDAANNAALRGLRGDLSVLKDDAAATLQDAATLAKNLKNEGGAIARDGVKNIAAAGRNEFEKLEDRVREKPGQSVALAFCAGLIFSYILGSRR